MKLVDSIFGKLVQCMSQKRKILIWLWYLTYQITFPLSMLSQSLVLTVSTNGMFLALQSIALFFQLFKYPLKQTNRCVVISVFNYLSVYFFVEKYTAFKKIAILTVEHLKKQVQCTLNNVHSRKALIGCTLCNITYVISYQIATK